eukprot:1145275-Pelagomonas_calceolata.AAC.1
MYMCILHAWHSISSIVLVAGMPNMLAALEKISDSEPSSSGSEAEEDAQDTKKQKKEITVEADKQFLRSAINTAGALHTEVHVWMRFMKASLGWTASRAHESVMGMQAGLNMGPHDLMNKGYKSGPSVMGVKPPKEEDPPNWSWSSGTKQKAMEGEETIEERRATHQAATAGVETSAIYTQQDVIIVMPERRHCDAQRDHCDA